MTNITMKKIVQNWEISLGNLGFGTWGMGWFMEEIENYDDTRDIAAIKYAVENGITHFDTAELYAAGKSEEILGKALAEYDRTSLFIASKVKWVNCTYDQVKKSCKESLQRLWMDYLDLYYIHSIEEGINLKKVIQALDELVDEGLIKHIGVSNFSVESLKKAQEYSKYKISVNQVHFSLEYRELEKELLEYSQKNDILIVAWRPIDYEEGGILAKESNILQEIAEKYSMTPAQVCLQFVLAHKNVVTIFKSTSPEHITENIEALNFTISDEDIERLRNEFPNQKYIGLMPLKGLDEVVEWEEEPLLKAIK